MYPVARHIASYFLFDPNPDNPHALPQVMDCVTRVLQDAPNDILSLALTALHTLTREGSLKLASQQLQNLANTMVKTEPKNAEVNYQMVSISSHYLAIGVTNYQRPCTPLRAADTELIAAVVTFVPALIAGAARLYVVAGA